MKKTLALLVVAAIVVVTIFVLMNNSSSQVRKLEKFTATVEQEYETYSQSDLDKAVAEYNKISDNIDESKLSDAEKKQVSRLRGECNGYFAKAKGRLVMEQLHNAGETVKGVIDAVTGKKKK